MWQTLKPHGYIVCGLALGAAALASYTILSREELQLAPTSLPEKAASQTAEHDGSTTDNPRLPSFDVVRVEPNGDAVIAGRATPGAAITLLRNGTTYAEGLADPSGAFVVVLPQLPVGASEILLRSIGADGSPVYSATAVTTVIASNRSTQPMVALTSADKPTLVLSAGIAPDAGQQERDKNAPGAPSTVRIASVDVQAAGGMFVSGKAAPDAQVRLSLNESVIAEGKASPEGRVTFDVRKGAQPGDYRVRLDEIDPMSGRPRSHAEADFALPAVAEAGSSRVEQTGAIVIPHINTTVVSRGDNLWSISRKAYGRGLSYTLIFGANRPTIRDPNRIYPKQVFVIPGFE
jgi:nucleoid-associated protein YgaU